MSTPSPAQADDLIPTDETLPPASGHSDNSPTELTAKQAEIVAELIAQKRVPEFLGILELLPQATQEKLLAKWPFLPWYPPDPSEGGIWREE